MTGPGVDPRVRRVSHIARAVVEALTEKYDHAEVVEALRLAHQCFTSGGGDPHKIRAAVAPPTNEEEFRQQSGEVRFWLVALLLPYAARVALAAVNWCSGHVAERAAAADYTVFTDAIDMIDVVRAKLVALRAAATTTPRETRH